MDAQTLLLTPWYSPHKILCWQKAISMLYTGDVEVVQEYDEVVCSPSISMRLPAVVRLKKAMGSVKRVVKFSRLNVLVRDNYRCQYCGERKEARAINYDHVIPRAQGGKTVWENIVSACYSCNNRKANRTPEQAGMRLLSVPRRPKTLPMSGMRIPKDQIHASWASFIPVEAS